MMSSPLNTQSLRAFDVSYSTSHQASSEQARGAFLSKFPLSRLARLSMGEYVIGTQRPTFCAFVEAKTRAWANIQGATSLKFGIYFGRTKSDAEQRYRYQADLGETEKEAYRTVKRNLLALVALGQAKKLDFQAIDDVPISQMFKAKILSLYFPKRFLNICSGDHLRSLAEVLHLPSGRPISEYQHRLLEVRGTNAVCEKWTNPKFMAYLYETYINSDGLPVTPIRKPRKKPSRPVNFDEIQEERDRIGKLAEAYALEYEQERLRGADLEHLVERIKDRREYASDGYDFLSFSTPDQPRFIEVKSIAQERGSKDWRFFLSTNEFETSTKPDKKGHYYFYLVRFDGKGKPCECLVKEATDLLNASEMEPAAFKVLFDLGQ